MPFQPTRGVTVTGLEFFSGTTFYGAKVTSDGELAVTETERERNVALSFLKANILATSYFALIDLSDTTNFKHNSTGRIDVSQIISRVDKASGVNGSLKIGVVQAINGNSASIAYLNALAFYNNGETKVEQDFYFTPSQLKFGVTNSALTRAMTNDTEVVTAVNTAVILESFRGLTTVTPAVGDIILKAELTGGSSYSIRCDLFYHSESTP